MIEKGESRPQIEEKAKEFFDKLWKPAYDLAWLDPNGKALSFLGDFSRGSESYNEAETMARWTGTIHRLYPELSKSQENEVFDFLVVND